MKRFLSIAAALAIVGGVAISTPTQATAGTVAVKGDTAVTMYGFINLTAGWAKKMSNYSAGFTNMPNESNDDSRYSTTAKMTRLGLNFSNKEACVSGRIEFDFANEGNSTRLRRAYINYGYDNFYILAGQEWGIEEVHTFSTNWKAIAGFNGNGNRYPQVRFGYNFDLGGADLKFEFALEDKDWTSYGSGLSYSRKTIPAIAAKLATKIDTGFGKPARIYAFGTLTPLKINVAGDEKDKTPYILGAGFNLPVSMVNLQAEYIYTKGATKFSGLTSNTPASYYIKAGSSDIEAAKSMAWNIEAKVKPMPKMWLAAGYDYVKFKDTTYANDPKVETIFANIGYKTTKYTVVSLEWLHVEAKDFSKNKEKGNSVFFKYFYKF